MWQGTVKKNGKPGISSERGRRISLTKYAWTYPYGGGHTKGGESARGNHIRVSSSLPVVSGLFVRRPGSFAYEGWEKRGELGGKGESIGS